LVECLVCEKPAFLGRVFDLKEFENCYDCLVSIRIFPSYPSIKSNIQVDHNRQLSAIGLHKNAYSATVDFCFCVR
jgi:hypothetical protein